MRMTCRALVGVAAAVMMSLLGGVASADDAKKDSGGYEYWFPVDALAAPGQDGTVPQIKVRSSRHRDGLMRPRVNFVPEMLKSVEGM